MKGFSNQFDRRVIGTSFFAAVFVLFVSVYTGCDRVETAPRAAVSSNFGPAATELARRFKLKTGTEISLVLGSTGKGFAQIRNGAPYDLFLAADSIHPKLLEDQNVAIRGTRRTYAYGKLVLWSPKKRNSNGGKTLKLNDFRRLAIANPKLAPYGSAAIEVLTAFELTEERLGNRLVRGENVGQAYQFVKSGNVDVGFVAYSQVIQDPASADSIWIVPQDLYKPIDQQAVLLTNNESAREFMDYLKSPEALEVIRSYGYGTP